MNGPGPQRKGDSLAEERLKADADNLLSGVCAGSGKAYLDWLATYLVSALDVEFAFVGELWGEDWDRVRTLSLASKEGLQDNFEYDLLGTPCSNVVGRTTCIYPEEVAPMFPEDAMLLDMGIESYVGTPLMGEGGVPLGLVVVLDRRALSQERVDLAVDTLALLRGRTEGELGRRKALRDLRVIVEGTTRSDRDPLKSLTRALAHAMHVRAAFVATTAGENRLRQISLSIDGESQAPQEIERALSPCGGRAEPCFYPSDVRQGFDGLPWLDALGAQSYVSVPLRDSDGQVVGQVGLAHDRPLERDPTELPIFQVFRELVSAELARRRHEDERLDMERSLYESQRRESLGVLAGGIAHDFNNLLVAVMGNADLILHGLTDGARARGYAEEILKASKRAADLSHQLLAYAGRGHMEPRPVDLSRLVGDVEQLLRVSVPHKVKLEYAHEGEPVLVRADESQLHQVVLNLIKNAADAIGDEAGTITVRTGTVHVTSEQLLGAAGGVPLGPGVYAFLRVTDTGGGMDEATRARIFEPFFSTKSGGHGLGLAALLGIVRGHQGAIWVESNKGQGTTFRVLIPLKDCGASERANEPARAAKMGEGRLVLVVDDEARVRAVVRAMLEKADFQVIEAADGSDGVALFRKRDRELACVLLDLSMPRMDGPATVRVMRELNAEVPLLLMSGYPKQEVLERFEPGTLAGIIHKPFDASGLIPVVLNASREPT